MSTPTEYRLLKERHEALRAAVVALADEWEAKRSLTMCTHPERFADILRALLEGDAR